MEIGKILRKARNAAKLTLANVEHATGVIASRQSKIELGETTAPDFMAVARLAEYYGLSLDGLYEAAKTGADSSAVAAKARKSHYVPIIPWEQLGQDSAIDLTARGLEVISAPFQCSDQAYALTVRGDSMAGSPGSEYSFPEGAIIIVEPNLESRHKNLVIARLEGSKTATFKRLNLEDGGFLQPLNSQYPTQPITDQMTVCGVVIGIIQKVNY